MGSRDPFDDIPDSRYKRRLMLAFELGYYTMFFLWIKFRKNNNNKKTLQTPKLLWRFCRYPWYKPIKSGYGLLGKSGAGRRFCRLLHDTAVKYLVPNLWIRDCETLLLWASVSSSINKECHMHINIVRDKWDIFVGRKVKQTKRN